MSSAHLVTLVDANADTQETMPANEIAYLPKIEGVAITKVETKVFGQKRIRTYFAGEKVVRRETATKRQ